MNKAKLLEVVTLVSDLRSELEDRFAGPTINFKLITESLDLCLEGVDPFLGQGQFNAKWWDDQDAKKAARKAKRSKKVSKKTSKKISKKGSK